MEGLNKKVTCPILAVYGFLQMVFLLAIGADFLLAQTSDTTSEELMIEFQNIPTSATSISGENTINATTNIEPDSVEFRIISPQDSIFTTIKNGPVDYSFIWDTVSFPDGYYYIEALAIKGTLEDYASFSVNVENNDDDTTITTDATTDNPDDTITTNPDIEITVLEPENIEEPSSDGSSSNTTTPDTQDDTTTTNPDYYTDDSDPTYDDSTYDDSATTSDDSAMDNTTSSADDTTSITDPLKISFVKPIQSPFSGDQKISISLNQEVFNCVFKIYGPTYTEFPAIKDSPTNYHIVLNTKNFPNGNYTIKAVAGNNIGTAEVRLDIKIENQIAPEPDQTLITEPVADKPTFIEPENLTEPTGTSFPIKPALEEPTPPIEPLEQPTIESSFISKPRIDPAISSEDVPATIPEECLNENILTREECEIYLREKHLPRECLEAGIETRSECDEIMFKEFGPPECLEAGIGDEKECQEFIFNKYASEVKCNALEEWQCQNFIKDNHLGAIMAKQTIFAELRENIVSLAGETIELKKLEEKIGTVEKITPLKENTVKLRIVSGKEEIAFDKENNLIQTAPIILMIDSDMDGLPDDLEKRIGTDPNKTDTDGDGFNDEEEVKNGYNPLGEGKLGYKISPIDEAILQNKSLEHPKTKGEETESLVVENIIDIIKTGSKQTDIRDGYLLSGKSEPNSVIALYIYSDLPLVITTKTDEYGNWQYELSESLTEGEHEVYVTINDNTGKVVKKSKPLNFFIKEASALSVKDFISPIASATSETPKESENSIRYYLIIAFLTILSIFLFVIILLKKKRQVLKS